jgi:hypothetical protein
MTVPEVETALRETQVIERHAPVPRELVRGPHWSPTLQEAAVMTSMMGDAFTKLMFYNKNSDDRICPQCMTKYRPLSEHEGRDRVHLEQRLSGICSEQCWLQLNGPDGYDKDEWMGRSID